MAEALAYQRTSTDKQDIHQQKVEILEYAHRERVHINDFISISISAKREWELLRLGVSARRISAKHFGHGTPSSSNYYINTRGLR